MSLSRGETFGPYEVIEPLGAGGMGEVYRAKDTRLDRLVALKVSKTAFDERFEREARAVAALSHPHICALYDVGPNYLVMELVEGVPLAGPLPIEKAVEYAVQILDALDAAHKKGITHRDLKPANILVTKHGIRLLDFGLAKQTSGPLGDAQATMSALTSHGQIVGTLQYMAPEQLQGQPTDARADLFAFGCVLYELLSGKRAFDGSSPASVIAAILERQPAPLTTHPPLDRVIATCLAKNPDDRFQTALDTKRAMRWAMEQPLNAASAVPASRRRERAWVAVAAVSIAVAIATVGWPPSKPGSTIAAPRMQVSIDTPPDDHWRAPALSPDGSRIAFIADSGILIRAIDSLEAQRIAVATISGGAMAWSPDGRSVAFCGTTTSQTLELHTVAVAGGSLRNLGATCGPFERGLAWAGDGTILFGTAAAAAGGISRIPESGGKPAIIRSGTYPTMLPDGRHYLWNTRSAEGVGTIHIGATDSADTRQVAEGDSKAEFTSGHLVFMRGTTLMAQPFDVSRLATTGDAFPIASDARTSTFGSAEFSVASNGLIVYRTGGIGRTALAWVDRAGKELSVIDDGAFHLDIALSPSGRALADTRVSPTLLEPGLWITDLSRGIATRLAPELERPSFPVWSMDGERVAYWSRGKLLARDADGSGSATVVAEKAGQASWFPDGKTLMVTDDSSGGGAGIPSVVSVEKGRAATPWLDIVIAQAAVSPDGKWVAYVERQSGQFEVYVQSMPIGRGKWQISTAGGAQPIWRRDGRELFYRGADDSVMAVPIAGDDRLAPGVPKPLFKFSGFGVIGVRSQFAVSPDGQRFLINRVLPDRGRTILLQNWLPSPGSLQVR